MRVLTLVPRNYELVVRTARVGQHPERDKPARRRAGRLLVRGYRASGTRRIPVQWRKLRLCDSGRLIPRATATGRNPDFHTGTVGQAWYWM